MEYVESEAVEAPMRQLSYRALFLFLLGLLLIAATIFGGPARGSSPSQTVEACEDGYALWAAAAGNEDDNNDDDWDKGEGDEDDLRGVRWTGPANTVQGRVHSNNDIIFYSSFNSVDGSLEYADAFYNFGLANLFSNPQQVAPASAPVSYNLDDYRPGGALAAAAEAEGRYHFINGGLEIQSSSVVLDGLYYVTDAVSISGNNLSGNVTIVSEERIEISGNGHDLVANSDGLLFYAADPGVQSMVLGGDDGQYRGIVFSEGDVQLDGSDSGYDGVVVAEEVNIAGDSLTVRSEVAYCPGGAGPTSTPPSVPSSTATATVMPTPTPTATGMPPSAVFNYYMAISSLAVMQGPGEPNDRCEDAFGLLTGVPYFFLPEDPQDWYQFFLQESGNLTVQLTNFAPEEGQAALYYGSTCGSLAFVRNNGDPGSDKSMALGQQPAGRYFLFVGNDGPMNSSDHYRLEIKVGP